jgi:hypothetical protein
MHISLVARQMIIHSAIFKQRPLLFVNIYWTLHKCARVMSSPAFPTHAFGSVVLNGVRSEVAVRLVDIG